jgi:hypothetical protein
MPKTGSPLRLTKSSNAPIKTYMTQKNIYIDVYVTAVHEISIAVTFKDTNPPGSSFLYHYVSLSNKWDIMAFMDRKTPGGENIMKYSSAGNFYNWKTMVTLHPTNIYNYVDVGDKIAKGLTKFGIEEKHNKSHLP